MDFPRYLELLDADVRRIVDIADDQLAAPVPSCPGWQVRDVIVHLAMVYLHKIECMRNLAPPDPWPPKLDESDPVGLLRSGYDSLGAQLRERGPRAPAFTWHPSDQTVGFWYRRMALETVVHRLDVELSAGTPTPVPEDLAADGIDEVLTLMLAGDWSDAPLAGDPFRVELCPGGATWLITLEPRRITCEQPQRPVEPRPDLGIAGSAAELFGWLWGRGSLPTADITGDDALVTRLRDRLVLATQ